ncbi:MAG: hypothetical protein A2744_02100 [Candidatus Buchananbacteria bacterium RIFCSPHIGHO2_01_FULL_44_11]|uniref:Uncharacterized protein n=1 Tax=Candidatus Buchananbacteria bacterium RIFCSPHIGHO2_01_FULL_44_11 TaxID=1797535 RepID=A0A1G1Y1K3_9BACT|nr:MAG: hypothetical protein A2744_02100 [Candidatus Buchananbacteria bacterium RIFCSPHIGHO2_01_FULL_44_11]
MKLKLQISKFKIFGLIIKLVKYLYLIVILIALGALAILGLFLYKNLYVTITQSEEIILLKQEVAPDTIDRTKVNTVLSALEKKSTSADNIDWSQVKNPFNFSVQTPAPSQIGID